MKYQSTHAQHFSWLDADRDGKISQEDVQVTQRALLILTTYKAA